MTSFGEWLGKHNADNMLYELLKEDLTKEQFRAIWTTYCIICGLEPDTDEYDGMLIEIYEHYWNFPITVFEEYDFFMSELLC